jgi:predicted SprT family Zn-dependent metalloprotease
MSGIHTLLKYLPVDSHDYVTFVIKTHPAHIHISSQRSTKLGDFRPAPQGQLHRISVNHNLNPYSFLITLIHEFAHLLNWDQHKNKVKPHGNEWKLQFQRLMNPLMDAGIFPGKLHEALQSYMLNPSASSCADRALMLALRSFDKEQKHYLCDLEHDAVFKISTGRAFIRKEKRRKFYTCIELHTGRKYLVNELAEVVPLNKDEQNLPEKII